MKNCALPDTGDARLVIYPKPIAVCWQVYGISKKPKVSVDLASSELPRQLELWYVVPAPVVRPITSRQSGTSTHNLGR